MTCVPVQSPGPCSLPPPPPPTQVHRPHPCLPASRNRGAYFASKLDQLCCDGFGPLLKTPDSTLASFSARVLAKRSGDVTGASREREGRQRGAENPHSMQVPAMRLLPTVLPPPPAQGWLSGCVSGDPCSCAPLAERRATCRSGSRAAEQPVEC